MHKASRSTANDVQSNEIPCNEVIAVIGDIFPHGKDGEQKRFVCWPEDSSLNHLGSLTFLSSEWFPDDEKTPLPEKKSFVVLSQFERRKEGWTAHRARNLRFDED